MNMASRADQRRAIARIIARAWQDEEFKKELKNNPVTTLRAAGLEVPEGVRYEVVENTADREYIVIPARPAGKIEEKVVEDVLASALTWTFTCTFLFRPPGPPPGVPPKPPKKGGRE
jgi:hypothetical protein